jgi:hypothetical protein
MITHNSHSRPRPTSCSGVSFLTLVSRYLSYIINFATIGVCNSNLFMTLDIGECLEGLRLANADTTPPDSPSPSRVGRQDSGMEVEADPAIVMRMSIVEIKLLKLLDFDIDIDENKAKAKAKRCSVISKPKKLDVHSAAHAFPCRDTFKELPAHPGGWPQRPLMIRPTPWTSTKIIGIRRVSTTEYQHFPGFCAGCILPVNTGSEVKGESLVIDFESPHFVGTLLMRIKQAPKSKNVEYQTSSYFDKRKRKFQAIVKGRFKTPLPMSQCVTGQSFHRPAGKLPARWIVTSFVKFVSTLAPQLEATIDGDEPRFLTPLVATAHTVLAKPKKKDDISLEMEDSVEEPPSVDATSLMLDVKRELNIAVPDTTKSSITNRMKARKKAYNSVGANKQDKLLFSLDKEYTFEFYQHLLDFSDELAVDMGRPIGKVGLAQATDGQPLKFMSAHQDPVSGELDSLWSFDIWHESLYPYAELALEGEQ